MEEELVALHNNETWSFVRLSPRVNLASGPWVLKVKRHGDGSFSQRKTRFVAWGFNQVEGVVFFKTFNPTIKFTTVL